MGEALVLYGAAAVLMSIVTALGFNIANDEKGTATINKMAEDLYKAVVPGVKIIAGTVAAGLSPNLLYLYMQVVNGKTSVPQNLISWVNQWLNDNKIYGNGEVITPNYTVGSIVKFADVPKETIFSFIESTVPNATYYVQDVINHYNLDLSNKKYYIIADKPTNDKYTIYIRVFKNVEDTVVISKIYTADYPWVYNPPQIPSTINLSCEQYRGTYRKNEENKYYRQLTDDISISPVPYKTTIANDQFIGANISNYGDVVIDINDTGFEAGENVPGKDVVIPGEGTEGITNEDIVGWLKSAVGQAVSEALGIGTEELQYVPVGIENPALSGEVSDVLANAATQDKVQTGVTSADIVQSGNNTANVTISQNTPVSSVKTSSLYTIWNPTQEQLNSLANFLWSTDFVDLIKKVLQSPMDAMISLALFPIRPKTDGTHIINLGYVPSGVSALRVSDQFQTFQTSGLVIPHKYNSYLDYSPYTTAEIYLPFIGFQRLNINDVMGKTVSVVYNIDMLSGICTALVKVDDTTMYSYSGNMAMFLPLSAGNWARMMTPIFGAVGGVASMGAGIAGVMSGSSLLGSTSTAVSGAKSLGNLEGNAVSRSGEISGNAGILGDYQPFIVVTRPINDRPSTYNSNIGQTYNKSVQLGTLSGFTIVDEAHVEGMSATETEKNEIERLLKEGVIF